MARQVSAIILLGSGDPTLNTTAPGGALADGGWKYVGAFGWSMGTAIGPHHFITAKHVGQPANEIVYQGKSYPILRSVEDPYSDLRIFEIDGTFPDYAPLYSKDDELGKNIVVIGRGTQRGQPVSLGGKLRGWQWGAGDMVQRWGENQISDATGTFLYASFDQNGGSNECMLSSGDSGGPMFINDGGIWKLAGINSSINSSIMLTPTSTETIAAIFDMRGFYGWNGELVSGSAPVPSGFFAVRMSAKLPWLRSIIAPGLANISARALVGRDEKVAIAGFIVSGNPVSKKRILVRGLGPSLVASGITGTLSDPTLSLYDSHGVLLASNDNWTTTQAGEITTTGLAPDSNKEAALLVTIPPGEYTAILRGADNSAGGVGLIELYDIDPISDVRVSNLSARAYVGQGDNVLIGGIVFSSASESLLLRVSGPSLSAAGISDALPATSLELRDSDGNLVGQNDDWRDNNNAAAIARSGYAPNAPEESALFLQPSPGLYTAVVRGRSDATGIGMVEAFILPAN